MKPIRELGMRRAGVIWLASVGLLATHMQVSAAVRDLSRGELTVRAELIVSGRVTAVEIVKEAPPAWVVARDDISPDERPSFVDASYTITIRVSSIEKGNLDAQGKDLVFHASRTVKRPARWVGGGGTIRVEPKIGDNIRVHLKLSPVGWTVFSPSGVEASTPP